MRFTINGADCVTRDGTIPESEAKAVVMLISTLISRGMRFEPSPPPLLAIRMQTTKNAISC